MGFLFFHFIGEFASVYVRNLPSDVTAQDLEREFKNFGRIKANGIFIRNRKVNVSSLCSQLSGISSLPIMVTQIKEKVHWGSLETLVWC